MASFIKNTLLVLASALALSTTITAVAVPKHHHKNVAVHHQHQIHDVQVGGEGILAFTPGFVFANPGDIVRFEFLQKNHSATQSSFWEPCTAKEEGVDSGFRAFGIANPFFDFEVPPANEWNEVEPQWFYCAQGTHCTKDGMVFAVNPNVDEDFTEFFSRAKGLIE